MKPDIARDATYHRASDALRSRVTASLGRAARAERAPSWRHGWMLAASFATVALVSWNVAIFTFASARGDDVAREVVAAHVRSLMAPGHLNDVESTDQHTVKPWFAGRLDFAPPVRDLTASGFPLAGGRLDYIDGRPVAALTYKRRLHTVNLFVWPVSESDTPPASTSVNGYSVASWTRDSMRYWAVSDAAPAEVAGFARAMTSASP
jgi:anti-sigma factor RsiW